MSTNNCRKLGHLARVCRSTSNKKYQNWKNINASQDETNNERTNERKSRRNTIFNGEPLPAAGESSWEEQHVFRVGATGEMHHAIVEFGELPVPKLQSRCPKHT